MDFDTLCSESSDIAQVVAAIVSIVSLIYYLTTFGEQMRIQNYIAIDQGYALLLEHSLREPRLSDPNAAKVPEIKPQYDIYAFMVWNFLESIHDLCTKNTHLRATWYPIIDAESQLFRPWFDRPENRLKFKVNFVDFIETRRTGNI